MGKESRVQYRVNSLDLIEINRVLQQLGDRLDELEGRRGTPVFKEEIKVVDSEGNILHQFT